MTTNFFARHPDDKGQRPARGAPTLGLVMTAACLLPQVALADTDQTKPSHRNERHRHHDRRHHHDADQDNQHARDGRPTQAQMRAQAAAEAGVAVPPHHPAVESLDVLGHGAGYRELQPHLDRLRTSLLDTPQTITEIPKQVMADQNNVSMLQALQTVPGISIAAGEGAQQGDNLSIRGFNAQNDFYRDGMLDFGSYYRDPFDLEAVEVIKGPSGALFGRGSTGGVINESTKRADQHVRNDATLSFGTDGTKRLTADVDRSYAVLGGTAVRLNAMVHDAGVADVDFSRTRRYGIAPSIAFGLNTSTRLRLDDFWQQSYDSQSYGLPWINGRPAPVPRRSFYGYNGDYNQTRVNVATMRLEHDLSQHITIHDQLRYSNYNVRQRAVEPEIFGYTKFTDIVPAGTPLSAIDISRNVLAISGPSSLLDNQTEIAADFMTGPVKNQLLAGMEEQRQTADITRYNYLPRSLAPLLDPQAIAVPMAPTLRAVSGSLSTDYAPYINDTLSWRAFQILGAYRFDDYTTKYHQMIAPTADVGRSDKKSTFRTAFVYKPAENGTVYFSYGTSFDPSGENVSLTAATAVLVPQTSHTYEAGTKWNIGGLNISGALYKIVMDNVRETNPANATTQINAGTYRSQGAEISVAGQITRAWSVFGGYSYDDATVIKSPNILEMGNQPPNAPKHTLALWTEYRLTSIPLEFGAGVNYTSSRTASSFPVAGTTVLERAPGYTTGQLMAKYRITDKLSAQVNVSNISSTRYTAGLHPTHIVMGPGRAALFSISAHY